MTERNHGLDHLASRASHALFWIVLGDQAEAEGELLQLSAEGRAQLREHVQLLADMLNLDAPAPARRPTCTDNGEDDHVPPGGWE